MSNNILHISPSEMHKLVIIFSGSYQPWVYREIDKFGEDARAIAIMGLREISKSTKDYGRIAWGIKKDKRRYQAIVEKVAQFVLLNRCKKIYQRE